MQATLNDESSASACFLCNALKRKESSNIFLSEKIIERNNALHLSTVLILLHSV